MTKSARITTRAVFEDSENPTDSERIERTTDVTCAALLPYEYVATLDHNNNVTLLMPTGAQHMTIIPVEDDDEPARWTLKGDAGDTGVILIESGTPAPWSMPCSDYGSIVILCELVSGAGHSRKARVVFW